MTSFLRKRLINVIVGFEFKNPIYRSTCTDTKSLPQNQFPMDVTEEENQAEGVNTSIALLNDVWRTEVNAPEILNYNSYLVDSIRDLLSKQQV